MTKRVLTRKLPMLSTMYVSRLFPIRRCCPRSARVWPAARLWLLLIRNAMRIDYSISLYEVDST